MTYLSYAVLTILIALITMAALYLVCLASMLWFGDFCQICRLFRKHDDKHGHGQEATG